MCQGRRNTILDLQDHFQKSFYAQVSLEDAVSHVSILLQIHCAYKQI